MYEYKFPDIGKFDRAAFLASQAAMATNDKISLMNLDFRLQDPSPSLSVITESIQWALVRYRDTVACYVVTVFYSIV